MTSRYQRSDVTTSAVTSHCVTGVTSHCASAVTSAVRQVEQQQARVTSELQNLQLSNGSLHSEVEVLIRQRAEGRSDKESQLADRYVWPAQSRITCDGQAQCGGRNISPGDSGTRNFSNYVQYGTLRTVVPCKGKRVSLIANTLNIPFCPLHGRMMGE